MAISQSASQIARLNRLHRTTIWARKARKHYMRQSWTCSFRTCGTTSNASRTPTSASTPGWLPGVRCTAYLSTAWRQSDKSITASGMPTLKKASTCKAILVKKATDTEARFQFLRTNLNKREQTCTTLHKLQQYDTTFTDILLDEELSGITTLRRTGPFTYEKAMRCPDSMKETIDWGDDCYSPYAGREKYEYSSYGDK